MDIGAALGALGLGVIGGCIVLVVFTWLRRH